MSYIVMQKPITNTLKVQNHHSSCAGMSAIFMGGQRHKSCE